MVVQDGVLKSISLEDIKDGCLKIPEGVTIIKKLKTPLYLDLIKEISLPESLEIIRKEAFNDYHSLENVTIPKNVKKIEREAFSGCHSLKTVHILGNIKELEEGIFAINAHLVRVEFEEGIKKIPDFCFEDCISLTEIEMKEGTEVIGTGAFARCRSLKQIKIPSSVKEIEKVAFQECLELKNVEFSEGLETIRGSAFSNCTALTKIKFPESLKTMDSNIFEYDEKLKEIYLPGNIETIKKGTFRNIEKLSMIKTPWGDFNCRKFDTRDIIAHYLFFCANHILKEKYKNMKDFLKNNSIRELLEYDVLYENDTIVKFKNIFFKMRKEYKMEPNFLFGMKKKTTEEFNYKTWRQVREWLPETNDRYLLVSLANMMDVFGIFHKDQNTQKRIHTMKQIFTERPYQITEDELLELLEENPQLEERKNHLFKRKENVYYILERGVQIPEDFAIYLKEQLTDAEVRKIKRVSGTFGKSLNTFVKSFYMQDRKTEFELIETTPEGKKLRQVLFTYDFQNTVNCYSLTRMFEDCLIFFDSDFYQFIVDKMDFILRKNYIQSSIPEIAMHFNQIRNHFFYQSGIKKVSIKQAIDYLECSPFDYHDGNYELSELVKKSGVKEQNIFEFYQYIYEKNQVRRLRSLIPRSNIYEVDGYIIQAELLRKDDPFAMLVGEKNYTNNCQVFNGIGHNCMAHATCSPDGGIFVTRLLEDGKWILLTESWDWKNNNLYCHDNIEGTPCLRFGDYNLKKAVAKVLKLDAEKLIEESKRQVSDYIEREMKKLSRLGKKEQEIELKRLKDIEMREPIKFVTCGDKNDDLDIELFFDQTIDVGALKDEEEESLFYCRKLHYENFQPVNYNEKEEYFSNFKLAYTDSNEVQYIIAGDADDAYFDTVSSLTPIHRDERKIVLEEGDTIRDYTVKKMNDIRKTVYPKDSENMEIKNAMDFQNSKIYLGEDWYLVYEQEDGLLTLIDLAKIKPDLEDEKGIQLQEMMNTVYQLISTSEKVETVLRGKRAYSLYLINKKLGYIEEIESNVLSKENEDEIEAKVYFKKGSNLNK